MNAKELKAIIKTLKEAGVSNFKTPELELSFKAVESISHETKIPSQPELKAKPLDAPIDEPSEIKHKVEELTSLLKLSDVDLVDRLFPDHTNYDEEVLA